MSFRLKSAALLSAIACLALSACSPTSGAGERNAPIRVGVMLPLTGQSQLEFEKSINWAVDEVNQHGVRGRKIVLDWEDLGLLPDGPAGYPARAAAAQRFLDDPGISAVIGTDYDDTTFLVAPAFIKAQKLLVSPSATTAEITRAFGGKEYIWRTLESDVAQSELMVLYGKNTGVKRAALLSTSDLYGETFFDWIPFYAAETGIEMTSVARLDKGNPDCSATVEKVLAAGTPDLVYLVAADYDLAKCLVERTRKLAPKARLMFSDGGQIMGLFEALGSLAEGIEGVSLEAYRDPAHTEFDYESEFDLAFQARFDEIPPPYAANAFDSVALIAYALAQSQGQTGEPLAQALKQVVDSQGETAGGELTSWSGDGIRRAISLMEQGKVPDVTGATGDLRFDPALGTDLTATTYAVWQVKDGIQQWDEIQVGSETIVYPKNYFTKDERRSKFDTVADLALLSPVTADVDTTELPPRRELWAFVAAFSRGWENYRHQADALNVYQLLRGQGVPDDHIVLMLADDIAGDPRNPEPGVVRNVAGGPDLNAQVVVDYRLGDATTKGQILRILSGRISSDTPQVVQSTANDDVLVFWVGHGGDSGVLVGGGTAEAAVAGTGSFITPEDLGITTSALAAQNSYRRLLVVLEACHGGVMGKRFVAPHALLMTGAGPNENSLGANFDVQSSIWRADSFAWAVQSSLARMETSMVTDLYKDAFLKVRGSHVNLYNAQSFGPNIVEIRDFVSP